MKLNRVYGVSVSVGGGDGRLLPWIQTACAPKDTEVTLEALIAAMAMARQGAIAEDILARCKASFVLGIESGCWTSPVHLAGFYTTQCYLQRGAVWSPLQMIKAVRAITVGDVTELCKKTFPVDKCTVVLGQPSGLTTRRKTISGALHLRGTSKTRRSRN